MNASGNISTMLKNNSMMPAPMLRAAKSKVSSIQDTGRSMHAHKGPRAPRP